MARKKRSRGPTRRKDGLFQQAITTPNGTRRHFYGKTRQEVLQKVAIAKGDIAQGLYREPHLITVTEWMLRWLNHKKRQVTDASYSGYERLFRRHIKPVLGGLTLDKVKSYIAQDFADSLDFAPETVNKILDVLSAAFQHATDLDLLPRNPIKVVKRPVVKPFNVKPLSIDDMSRFIEVNRQELLFPAVLLGLCLGLRRGEILGLRWRDVHLKDGLLSVCHSLDWRQGQLTLLPLKSESSRRDLPLPDVCHKTLQAHRARMAELGIGVGRTLTADTFVFHRPADGRAISPNMLRSALNRMLTNASLETRRIHDLRHTFGTVLAKLGEPTIALQHLMGHATIAITADKYTHVQAVDYRGTVQRIDEALKVVGEL